MAGWTVVSDIPANGGWSVKQKAEVDEFWVDLIVESSKIKDLFERVLHVVLEDISCGCGIRPMPPRLGDGKCVDLFRVCIAVRVRGGCEMVTECGLWNLVGERCGLGCGVGGSLKLIYVKYLDVLERWLNRAAESRSSKGDLGKHGDETGRLLCGLEEDLGYLLSSIVCKKNMDAEGFILGSKMRGDGMFPIKKENKTALNVDENVEVGDCMTCNSEVIEVDSGGSENTNDSGDVPDVLLDSDDGKVNCIKEPDDEVKKCMSGADDDIMISSTNSEHSSSQKKRKRDSFLVMMNWLVETAKNPCDPVTSCLPEKSKWKSYGNEHPWKQVLSAREQLFFKQKFNSQADQEFWLVSNSFFLYYNK